MARDQPEETTLGSYNHPAFGAHAETLPISAFGPLLRRMLAGPRQPVHMAALNAHTAHTAHTAHSAGG